VLLSAIAVGVPTAAGELPSQIRARDPRIGELRARVERAESARGEGRLDEAETLYREVVAEIDASERPAMLLARAVDGLGDLCRVQQRFDEAEAYYLRAAELWEPLLGPRQPRLATTLHNLGLVYLEDGRLDAADAPLRRALAIWLSALGPDSDQAGLTRSAVRRVAELRAEAQGASKTGSR